MMKIKQLISEEKLQKMLKYAKIYIGIAKITS